MDCTMKVEVSGDGKRWMEMSGLAGPTVVSRRFLEGCREDFKAAMGMTPEEFEAKAVEWVTPLSDPAEEPK